MKKKCLLAGISNWLFVVEFVNFTYKLVEIAISKIFQLKFNFPTIITKKLQIFVNLPK